MHAVTMLAVALVASSIYIDRAGRPLTPADITPHSMPHKLDMALKKTFHDAVGQNGSNLSARTSP